jgi:hypothetical protein
MMSEKHHLNSSANPLPNVPTELTGLARACTAASKHVALNKLNHFSALSTSRAVLVERASKTVFLCLENTV